MRAVDAVRHTRAARTEATRTEAGVSPRLFGTVTAAAWTLYAYLWLPAITLLAWTLGLRTAWVRSVLERASVDVDAMWLVLALIVLLGCALVLWAEQQRKRFTGLDRRRRADDVAPVAVATSLGVAPDVLHALQVAGVATVHLDAQGRPVRVKSTVPVATGAPAVPGQRRPVQDLTPRA